MGVVHLFSIFSYNIYILGSVAEVDMILPITLPYKEGHWYNQSLIIDELHGAGFRLQLITSTVSIIILLKYSYSYLYSVTKEELMLPGLDHPIPRI